jgi:hypothetical protein
VLPHTLSLGNDRYRFVSGIGVQTLGSALDHGVAYAALSRFEASFVLARVARERPELLRRLHTTFVRRDVVPCAAGLEAEQLLAQLQRALGNGCDARGRLGCASLRVLKAERRAPAPPPLVIAPERPPLAPRRVREDHYVGVLIKTRAGLPCADVACEFELADGSKRRASTDALGIASVRPVPAGTCKIRLLFHDAGSWSAPGAAPPQRVGTGPARTHVVRHGEHLMRLCLRHGLTDWKAVWEAAPNAALRGRRKSPHVLREGDCVVLPGIAIGEIERSVDATHPLTLQSELTQTVRLRLHDFGRAGLDGLEYQLSYEHAGKRVDRAGAAATDAEGGLIETLPVEVESVLLRFKRPKLTLALSLGALDPAQDADSATPVASGARARLCGLGYAPSAGQLTAAMVAQFQAEQLGRTQPSGELDGETCGKLEALYGT